MSDLDRKLLNYKQNAPPLYLDGRYFNIILGKYDAVSTRPIIVKMKTTGTETNMDRISIDINRPVVLFRVIVELYEQNNIRGVIRHKIASRHSNLLIIDNINRTISRFEPLIENVYSPNINNALIDQFRYRLPQHQYEEIDAHPQPVNSNGLCVAYVLKYAFYLVMGQPVIFEGESDIIKFALYVNKLYSRMLRGKQDIEFGMNPALGGAAFGGLTGAAIGGLAGGPAGAAVGLGVGALGGAAIGGLSSRR